MQVVNERKDIKKFIGVIGRSNAGKSTIIVSLTGCRNRNFRDSVTDKSNNESIYVIAWSPQERRLDPEGDGLESEVKAFRKILNQLLQNDNCRGLVMAIQPTRPRLRLSLEDIIQEVLNRDVFESYLFVLEPGRNDPPDGRGILAEVNQRLRNTPLRAQQLDGRRFAFLNARHINQASQLFI
ncbi:MAG: 50S ribosome-binding GTPase [Sedimentisphaerales bacterium]|nr:50S ribosome-binding GTPase [Sedimentisphaerales bacterium]